MSSEFIPPDNRVVTYTYDSSNQVSRTWESSEDGLRKTYTHVPPEEARLFAYEHDKDKRLFKLTMPDGSVRVFSR